MTKYQVIIQPPAEADMEAAYQWIAKSAPMTAAKWYNACIDAMRSLETLPRRCPLAPEAGAFRCEIRQLIYASHRILFTIQDKKVHILHVRHAARRHMAREDEPGPPQET
jgi:plasmid stabilization system protein ParE